MPMVVLTMLITTLELRLGRDPNLFLQGQFQNKNGKKGKYLLFENILIINFVLTYFIVCLYFDTLRYGTNSENIINLPSPLYKKNADFANYPSVCV